MWNIIVTRGPTPNINRFKTKRDALKAQAEIIRQGGMAVITCKIPLKRKGECK